MGDFTCTVNGWFGLGVEELELPADPATDDDGVADDVFLRGQCHAFAMALQEIIGGEIIGAGADDCNGMGCPGWGHVYVEKDGRCYDWRGKHTRRQVRTEFGNTKRTTAEYLMSVSAPTDGEDDMDEKDPAGLYRYCYYRPNMEAARVYAQHYVDKRGL